MELLLHHVSIPSQNLERSAGFYEGVLGLKRLERPPFPISGIWYSVGDRQIHVTVHPLAHFRSAKAVDNDDIHFAMHTNNFEACYEHLKSHGYSEDFSGDDPKRMILKRKGMAGFPQLFIMDPDRNILEINEAPFI